MQSKTRSSDQKKSTQKKDLNLTGRRLLTVEQTALYLGCSPKTLYNMNSAGTLPFQCARGIGRSVRFDIRDLDAWIDDQKKAA